MLSVIRSPRALAILAAGLVALSTSAFADPYHGGQGGYGRSSYGGNSRPQGYGQRTTGNAGYLGSKGGTAYNGGPQYRPAYNNGGPAEQPYPGPRTYYPQGAPQGQNPNGPSYGGPAPAPQPNQAPAPAPAAAAKPVYVYVVFQQAATAVETATFLRTYNVAVDDGPSNDGFFQLRVSADLPADQLKSLVESMRGQTKVVSRVESD